MSILRKLSLSYPKRKQTNADASSNGDVSPTANGNAHGPSRQNTVSETIHESPDESSGVPKMFQDVVTQMRATFDHSTLSGAIDGLRHRESMDDRKLLMEHLMTFISRMKRDSPLSIDLQNQVIKLLYNDLYHPPPTYLGDNYKFRSADGSNNSISDPNLGKAGQPYARSVQQVSPLRDLPDAGLVFDTLLQRDKFREHPGGLSSLMFAFAALVIHSVFRTSHTDVNINETSSYVDLAPLYGNDQATQDQVRKHDGLGLLHKDAFAENRLLLLPPAVAVLLVMFSRNHNYIAAKLFEINEHGTFIDPGKLSDEEKKKQDEEIFQTARLVNCGWFGTVVFSDYFSCILGLVRKGSNWSLSPFGDFRNDDHSNFERGQGNAVSVEFNCLYRWHATTSSKDEAWVTNMMKDIFKDKPLDDVTAQDFKAVGVKLHSMGQDLTHWTFGGMSRTEDGSFDDAALAKVLFDATEDPAAAFGARGTPLSMRLHEVMGIEQNRKWGVCTMNEFRKFLGLKTFETFHEWNPDPEIARAAEKLYGHIDNLELYVGLQAEDTKPLVDGAGLCPGYTIARAILSDAIALTRGDRFFTQDYTPANLTQWGFADCQRDPDAFGFGSALGKLFQRTLPHEFGEEGNSAYAFFPLMTPKSMKEHLEKMNLADKYDFNRPQRAPVPDEAGLKARSVKRASIILHKGGQGFYPASGDLHRRDMVMDALVKQIGGEDAIGKYFFDRTRTLIETHSFSSVGNRFRVVDIVRDVFKNLVVVWAADVGGISLKSDNNPGGMYTPAELYGILGDLHQYLFLHVEASRLMLLKEKVTKDAQKLSHQIKGALGAGSWFTMSTSFFGGAKENDDVDEKQFAKRLQEMGIPADEMVNSVLAVMVGASVEMSLALTNALDWALENDIPFHEGPLAEKIVSEALRKYEEKTGIEWGQGVSRCLGNNVTVKLMTETLRAVFSFPGMVRGPGRSGVLKRFLVNKEEMSWGYLDDQRKMTPWPTTMMMKFDSASKIK
ncbi:heme peroxidase, partial [Cylindrobasidium torrendii FP15055 ss-10]